MSGDLEWRVCPSFPAYEVSEAGDIRRWKKDQWNHAYGYVLSHKIQGGYKRYTLRANGKSHNIHAYRMVAEAFLGPKPFDKAEVCHNDGVKLNNHYSNLRWDTHKSNHLDRIEHGSSNRGETNGRARLTEDHVRQIRVMAARGDLQRDIADTFRVSRPAISMIVGRINWGHVA